MYGLTFHPDGSLAASCGLDAQWKKHSCFGRSIHKFEPQKGNFLETAYYDMTAKVWSSTDFKPVKVLSDHESKVTYVDVVAAGQSLATVSGRLSPSLLVLEIYASDNLRECGWADLAFVLGYLSCLLSARW
ncbi:U4/U6 small nuclear ribonucleoprotein PRP4-like protein [Tanacetum coccineum]